MIERYRAVLATAGQMMLFPAFWILAYIICRARVNNGLELPSDPKARFIIAANHQSKLDAFVITGIIKPSLWLRLLPYRYITANQFLYNPRYAWLLWPLGGFPAYQTKRENGGLPKAQQILKMGQTVCIFPEGQRSRKYETTPKRGVAVLASMPDAYILPIKLQWHKRPRRVFVSLGKAYKAAGHTPDDILRTIYELADT